MRFTGDSVEKVEKKDNIELYDPATSALEHRRAEIFSATDATDIEESLDLRAHWRVLKKRRWTILSILAAIFTIALVATLKEKPVYRAQTLLEIEKQNLEIPTVQELFQLENVSDTYLETQYKLLKSESLAKRVIASLHLERVRELNPAANATTGAKEPGLSGSAGETHPDARTIQAIVLNFEDRLHVQPVERSRLVVVSFDSQDPNLAANVANSLGANYIQDSLEARWNATQQARDWLSQQLDDLKIKLEKAEEELQRYAKGNGLIFLESDKGNTENITSERLREVQHELTQAQANRYQKESMYRLVEAGDYGSLPGAVENALMQNLTLRLSDLEAEHAKLATTYSGDYSKVKQVQNQIHEIRSALTVERKRVANRIANDYSVAVRGEALVEKAFVAQQKQANDVAAKSVQYSILKREVDTNKKLYDGLLSRLKEAGISAGLKASTIRIVDQAVPPTGTVKPRVFLNLALGLGLGLCCAIGVAFLLEHLDNTLKTPDDVERFLQLPALALIPAFESLNGNSRGVYGLSSGKLMAKRKDQTAPRAPGLYRIDETGPQFSVLREAFRSLRTSVLISTADRAPRSILITSAQPGEGKTTVSTNLAISLAQLGQTVLLIDGDMRRPTIHKAFQVKTESGLVSYLTGHQDWPAVVVPTNIPGLDIIPCGPVPPNPAELLSSERTRTLVVEALEKYTTVVLDSPPILNVADSRILSVLVDGVLLVARGNSTPRELVKRAQAHARNAGANIIGIVLNSVNVHRMDYYAYGYAHYDAYFEDGHPDNNGNAGAGQDLSREAHA